MYSYIHKTMAIQAHTATHKGNESVFFIIIRRRIERLSNESEQYSYITGYQQHCRRCFFPRFLPIPS